MFEKFMRRHLRRKGYVTFKRKAHTEFKEFKEPEGMSVVSLSIGSLAGAISWMCVAAVAGPEGMRRLLSTTVELLEEALEKASGPEPMVGRIQTNITVLYDGSDRMLNAIEGIVGHNHVTCDNVLNESGNMELGFVVPPDEIDDVWEELKARGWDCGRTLTSTEQYEASKKKRVWESEEDGYNHIIGEALKTSDSGIVNLIEHHPPTMRRLETVSGSDVGTYDKLLERVEAYRGEEERVIGWRFINKLNKLRASGTIRLEGVSPSVEWVGIGDNLEAKFEANGFLGIREIGSEPSGTPPRFGVGVTLSNLESLHAVHTEWTNIDNCALQVKRMDETVGDGARWMRWTHIREGTEDNHGPVIKMTSYSITRAKELFSRASSPKDANPADQPKSPRIH